MGLFHRVIESQEEHKPGAFERAEHDSTAAAPDLSEKKKR
jgi:hypothetical protein